MSSSTFDAQLDVASRVSAENPDLYFEIQSLNEFGGESLHALSEAVERLCRAVRERDPEAFRTMMLRGRDYLRVRQAAQEAPD
jgi:chorismate mutase/prephenate dehydrogenase